MLIREGRRCLRRLGRGHVSRQTGRPASKAYPIGSQWIGVCRGSKSFIWEEHSLDWPAGSEDERAARASTETDKHLGAVSPRSRYYQTCLLDSTLLCMTRRVELYDGRKLFAEPNLPRGGPSANGRPCAVGTRSGSLPFLPSLPKTDIHVHGHKSPGYRRMSNC